MFEEDGGVKGRGRKRTRFGRDSSAWRYSSQSPSPEPTSPVPDQMEEEDVAPQPSPKPQTMDEGCQTMDVDMEQAAPEPAESGVLQRAATPALRETPVTVPREEQATIHRIEQVPLSSTLEEGLASADHHKQVSAELDLLLPTNAKPRSNEEQQTETNEPNPPPANDIGPSPSTQFGPSSFAAGFPFGTDAPARVESALSLADQVRFGFSHVPQTTHFPSPPKAEPAPGSDHHRQDPYPASYLDDAPDPAKYDDMNTYLDAADEQDELAVHGQTMPLEPPVMERFNDGQWEMSTQSPHYNPIEGGHFGLDALNEGARLAVGEPSLHADHIVPGQVPGGFATYGHGDLSDRNQENPPHHSPPHEEQPFVENEDTISGSEVGVDDEEDPDAKFDELAYGEQIEEGDYDQRNYEVPADDDEGLSEEDDETELEAEERYGNDEVYDEDAEGEEWDEEDDYESGEEDDEEDEDEEEYDARGYQPRKPAAPVPAGEPVVISLLSDSEDEDEPPPAPRKSATAAQAVHEPQPAARSEQASSPRRQDSPGIVQTKETSGTRIEPALDNIFNRTNVVDFATSSNRGASQQLGVPPATMDTDTASSTVTSQAPGPVSFFAISNPRDESSISESEPTPSEGSSEGLFVSQPKRQPAPSEGLSEGLFVSKPRPRSPDTEAKRTDDGAKDGSSEIDSEAEDQTISDDDSLSVEEVEEDDVSFASQVEMVEELGESEDEYMSMDDVPLATDTAPGAPLASLEVEEATGSEEDVDMIDVSSVRFESASPESMASPAVQQNGLVETMTVVSGFEVAEVVSETPVTLEEPLPSAQILEPQEPGFAPSAAGELPEETPEEAPSGQQETPGAKTESLEEQSSEMGVSPTADLKPMTLDVVNGVPEHAQEAATQGLVEIAPAERDGELNQDDFLNDSAAHGMDGAGSEAGTEAREDAAVPDSTFPTQPLAVQAGLDGQEQAPEETQGASLQSDEFEIPDQLTPPAQHPEEDESMILYQLTQEREQYPEAGIVDTQARSPSPDISVRLARQAVAAKRSKKAPEPVRTSPRVTRARSSSLRSSATNGTPEKEEDNSVNLARAALASPSRRSGEVDGTTTATTATTAALKSELTKRLRTELPECAPLRSLRFLLDKSPNAVVVVTTQPTPPARAKGGPREYFMSFHATDPSAAPSLVVEVQLYRPHKDSLPLVRPGDVILLQRFQVKALSNKGYGLRTGLESAWAVWEGPAGGEDGDGEGGSQMAAPQIRGPPVEDWEGCVGYVGTLRRWFGLVMGDAAARAKLERADRKLEEAGGGGK